jgi:hypothetical protein
MNNRRQAIKANAGFTGLAATAAAQQHTHDHADPPSQQPATKPLIQVKTPKQPAFFSKPEFETLGILVDLIIPRTDTPGATDAGVNYLIDERVPRNSKLRKAWRDGLAGLDAASKTKYGKRFTAIDQPQQVDLLTAMSREKATASRQFFDLVKGATVDAYYETREGLQTELGWHGNAALTEFTGCTHPEHQG